MMDKEHHNIKACMEVNLLSFFDVLVTIASSTFEYAERGLRGLRPWILARHKDAVMPKPTCYKEIFMEPCFHQPHSYLVEKMMEGGKGKIPPYVSDCLDVEGGFKVFRRNG